MKKHILVLLIIGICFAGISQTNQDEKMLQSIYRTSLIEGQSYEWLDYLCNQIGGRLSGSLNAERAVEWAKKVVSLGAGEILLTSMDCDGTKGGFDNALNRAVSEAVEVPVIASGGAGTLDHLAKAISDGKTSAVLAASIFHFGTFTIKQAKEHLKSKGLPVRL